MANINLFIDRVSKADYIDDAKKKFYLGQAYGLRAFIYFELYRIYGGVADVASDLVAVVCDDDCEFPGSHVVHDLVDHGGGDECRRKTIEHGVHVSKNRPAEHDHEKINRHGHAADGEVWMESFDSHCEKVCAAGRGATHIDDGKSRAEKDARIEGRAPVRSWSPAENQCACA